MFFRSKPVGSYRYLQIVHSVREGKKVRQQVIATLGRLDILEASGQLERLMRSGLRHCESFAVLDAHAAGEIEPVAIRRIGPDLVFARLWKESGIFDVLRSLLKEREYDFDVERAIYLTVLHRLFASGSDRAAERWREDYLIPGTESLELHHLYRAMAFLGEAIEPLDHVFCSFLALLLKTELERRMKFADLKCEWAQVIRGLQALQQVEATFQDKRFVLRSQLTSEASAALRATGVAAPPTLRELS